MGGLHKSVLPAVDCFLLLCREVSAVHSWWRSRGDAHCSSDDDRMTSVSPRIYSLALYKQQTTSSASAGRTLIRYADVHVHRVDIEIL